MTRTDADFEGFTRLHGVDADLSQDGSMEQGVAAPGDAERLGTGSSLTLRWRKPDSKPRSLLADDGAV